LYRLLVEKRLKKMQITYVLAGRGNREKASAAKKRAYFDADRKGGLTS